jgi:VCBS repeat-containing protein
VTVNADGTFTYTPALNFNGTDSFTFKASDGSLDSAPATVTIAVSAINDAPVASALSLSTGEETAQTGTLSASDIDSPQLTYAKASNPANGTVTVNANGTFTYTPALNFNGTDSFTFKASDGVLESAVATVTIAVNAVNDPATGSLLITGTPGQGLTLQANLASFSDVDGAPPPNQSIRYEWRADNTVIANVSGPDLFLAPGLTGKSITVRAHFKDGLGTDEFVASSPSGPVLPGSISGEVRYWHGNEPVAATQIRMLDSVEVASSTAPVAHASSTADGRWSVPQLDFDTFAVKVSRVASATDHSSVSAADVLAALKLSVGRTPNADPDGPGPVAAPAAVPYQTIASDVTRDGFVRSYDAMLIMHAALKPASSPIWHWSFIAEGQGVSAVSRHTTFTEPPPSVSVVNGTTSNWIGILLGDVDGSWNPGVLG